jgi:hypothetical protein
MKGFLAELNNTFYQGEAPCKKQQLIFLAVAFLSFWILFCRNRNFNQFI